MTRRPPESTLFPYAALFRSLDRVVAGAAGDDVVAEAAEELVVAVAAEQLVAAAGALHEVVAAAARARVAARGALHGRSEEHTSELQSRQSIACRLLLEKNQT